MGESSSVDHSPESIEVAQSGSLGLKGTLLGGGGLFPLLLETVFLDLLGQVFGAGVSEDGDNQSGQGQSLDGDELSVDTSGGAVDQDFIIVEDIQNDGNLASVLTIVDVDDSADFNEVGVSHF
eukprot:TRINITY_DN72112_c0_g1_i1.p2 TRINITY_DN72112_c0_g1~~TRINITY_DN72112_c0_g1_i1.p2  ORF type:complete len:123 (+),score=23.41 TRINITY_DN72112_c0_g1_i1:191-559(+)